MRILHTVEFYEPLRGGAEEVVRRISEGLAQRGHNVTVATSYLPDRTFRTLNGVTIEGFQVRGNVTRGIHGEARRYQEFLRDMKFDVMMNYAAQVWTTDLALPILDEIRAAKVLAPCGYSALRRLWTRLLYAPYFRSLPGHLRQYDAVVYHSALTPDKTFGDRHSIRHFTVIPNGAALKEFAVPRANTSYYRLPGEQTVLLSVSNHYRIKGHALLFKAFQQLRRADVFLTVLGDRPAGGRSCYDSCEAAATRSGGSIRLFTNLSRAEVVSAFFGADLLVMTSEVECCPLVILEAMAAGTPWISPPVGNVRELCGGMVAESFSSLVDAMRFLIDHPAAREDLGRQGRECWLQRYTWESIIDSYEVLYTDLCSAEGDGHSCLSQPRSLNSFSANRNQCLELKTSTCQR